ncbi:MAG: type II toxin-antitoxin system Phd/YefM family antitoxin [Elusimicrobia bacterium]|nr:type II toxin-antitoxin system Phd/YefM family antitoxin [Elusimicrobiota bacterium]
MSITAAMFKARCLKLMDNVREQKATYVITKRGRPVARLVPIETAAHGPVFGRMKGTATIKGNIVGPLPERWDADEG